MLHHCIWYKFFSNYAFNKYFDDVNAGHCSCFHNFAFICKLVVQTWRCFSQATVYVRNQWKARICKHDVMLSSSAWDYWSSLSCSEYHGTIADNALKYVFTTSMMIISACIVTQKQELSFIQIMFSAIKNSTQTCVGNHFYRPLHISSYIGYGNFHKNFVLGWWWLSKKRINGMKLF